MGYGVARSLANLRGALGKVRPGLERPERLLEHSRRYTTIVDVALVGVVIFVAAAAGASLAGVARTSEAPRGVSQDRSPALTRWPSMEAATATSCGSMRVRIRSGNRTQCISIWRYLRRRHLRVPSLASGATCPTTAPTGDLAKLAPPGYSGNAFGPGPVYPGLSPVSDRPELLFVYPPPRSSAWYGSQWGGQKVIWIFARKFSGPTVVRGRQLDGPNELRFDDGLLPSRERRLVGPGGHPSSTRVRAPGCYAYQIDGLRFSYLIVFEAKLAPP
jgi:hypothetical protein